MNVSLTYEVASRYEMEVDIPNGEEMTAKQIENYLINNGYMAEADQKCRNLKGNLETDYSIFNEDTYESIVDWDLR